jgi:hypothetical protein
MIMALVGQVCAAFKIDSKLSPVSDTTTALGLIILFVST